MKVYILVAIPKDEPARIIDVFRKELDAWIEAGQHKDVWCDVIEKEVKG